MSDFVKQLVDRDDLVLIAKIGIYLLGLIMILLVLSVMLGVAWTVFRSVGGL